MIGGASPDERRALVTYGQQIGVAFQLADDLLDVEGDAEAMGKAVGKDAVAGKATLISLMGIDAARTALAQAEGAALAALAPFGDRADILRATARFVSSRSR